MLLVAFHFWRRLLPGFIHCAHLVDCTPIWCPVGSGQREAAAGDQRQRTGGGCFLPLPTAAELPLAMSLCDHRPCGEAPHGCSSHQLPLETPRPLPFPPAPGDDGSFPKRPVSAHASVSSPSSHAPWVNHLGKILLGPRLKQVLFLPLYRIGNRGVIKHAQLKTLK